ncbi:MAG: TOBE domain-containing protein, partial [Leptolyngbyaceae bacterium]|nr:TOBE domain-containing protein [Leptolyngbyaceae bacterium]
TPQQIILGIRPEQVRLAQPEEPHTLQGQVYLVENLGMNNLISVRVPAHPSGSLTFRALLPTDQKWSGDQLTLALPPEALHWFDVETGASLCSEKTS